MTERPARRKRGKSKGTPKTGGRQKGTPNRASLYVRAELERAGLNLVREFIRELENLPPGEARLERLQWLFQFVFPKLKEIEGPDDKPEPPAPPLPAPPASAQEPAAPPQLPPSTAPQGRDERMRIIHGLTARTPVPSEERPEVPESAEADPREPGE